MPRVATTFRFTLDCQALPWHVLKFEESTSLARPPGIVLDVSIARTVDTTTEIERTTASLLIEGTDTSRVVWGWVRHVEHIGVVDSRAHLRLHLVPTEMAENTRAQAVVATAEPADLLTVMPSEAAAEAEWVVEPAMVPTSQAAEPPAIAEDVTTDHTLEELRAMRGEDRASGAHRRPEPRSGPKEWREITEVVPRGKEPGTAPKQQRSAQEDSMADGTRLVTHADVHAKLASRTSGGASGLPDPVTERQPSPARSETRTGGTELMSREDLARLRTGLGLHDAALTGSRSPRSAEPRRRPLLEDRTERLSTPKAVTETERLRPVSGMAAGDQSASPDETRDKLPGRMRRKRKTPDDETSQMTWEEVEALHRSRGKPKP